MKAKVSILVPVYNVSAFIEKCAHSLFNQTFSDIEYIFVNDATPDDSIEKLLNVIEQYPQRKNQIKIIEHSENRGLASARNTALNNATGEYISVVDSDDYIEPEMIEVLYNKAIEENADIVISDMLMEHTSKTVYLVDELSDNNDHFSDIIKNEHSHSFLCNKLISKTLYEREDCRVPEGLNYYEDRHVMSRLFYFANKIVKVNRAFYHYVHYNTQAITKTKNRMHFENVVLFWNLLDEFLIKHNEFDKLQPIIDKAKIESKVRLMIDTHSPELRKEFATIFYEEETRCLNHFKRGEKLMLLFIRYKLFGLAQLFHLYLLQKHK